MRYFVLFFVVLMTTNVANAGFFSDIVSQKVGEKVEEVENEIMPDTTTIENLIEKAKSGDVLSQSKLGVMYAYGQGVAKDLSQAYAWLTLASGQGNEIASTTLNYVNELITPEQKTAAQKLIKIWNIVK
jgi:TPR repeat protein